MDFRWTTLRVKDYEKSLEFYRDIVQLPVKTEFTMGENGRFAFLGDGETQIELIHRPGDEKIFGDAITIGFRVDSLDEMIEFLKDKNIEIVGGPVQPTDDIRFIYVLDPNGLKVQFSESL
jgi:lactoylglutathione lyase